MAENTVNNEENLNSQSFQLEKEEEEKFSADTMPVNRDQKTACSSSMAALVKKIMASFSCPNHG